MFGGVHPRVPTRRARRGHVRIEVELKLQALRPRFAHPAQEARATKKPGAVSRTASRAYPACARMKKPISGKPEISTHFASFNFANRLICAVASS
jgi:hypothetical protein